METGAVSNERTGKLVNLAVITPFEAANFGAFLQAYALKSHLESQGHKVFHVRYRPVRLNRRAFYRIRPSRRDLLHPTEYWKNLSFGRQKHALFGRDLMSFAIIDPGDARTVDAVVLGSDEIWNIRNKLFQDPVFFGHRLERVIAYAPSVGASTIEDYHDQGERLDDIRQLRAVSARDSGTAEFVELVTSQRPPIVLDPTLLHTWKPEISHARARRMGDRYVLVYAYRECHVPVEALRVFARSRGLKLVSACFKHDWCDENVNCSPLEFLDLVGGADYVFTSTFHGAIFSIIHSKRFLCNPISPKSVDLLTALGLTAQMTAVPIAAHTESLSDLFDQTIDYRAVMDKVAILRSRSQSYLERALASVTEEHP